MRSLQDIGLLILSAVGVIICMPLLFVVVLIFIWSSLGYIVTANGAALASSIAEKHGKPTDCFKLRSLDLLGPTDGTRQNLCVYELAQLLRDPTICELLLPGDYGMECIGEIAGYARGEDYCYLQYKTITCRKGLAASTYEYQQTNNCTGYRKYKNDQLLQWCYSNLATTTGDATLCLSRVHTVWDQDDCYYSRALYKKALRVDICQKVKDPILRSTCIATAKAWMRYPELRPKDDASS